MMTEYCGTCGQALPHHLSLYEITIEKMVEAWREECRDTYFISKDGRDRILPATVALFLGVSEGHLANLRSWGRGPKHDRYPRTTYELREVAKYKLKKEWDLN